MKSLNHGGIRTNQFLTRGQHATHCNNRDVVYYVYKEALSIHH